ncbi:glycoside hydrolase family 36 protein [Verrucomicrobiota bacterium]
MVAGSDRFPNMIVATQSTHLELNPTDTGLRIDRLARNPAAFNWIPCPAVQALIDESECDGAATALHWTALSPIEERRGRERGLRLAWQCEELALSVESTWTACLGHGPVRHQLRVRNRDSRPIGLQGTPSLLLRLTLPKDHILHHFWVEKGSGCPSDTGVHNEEITPGYESISRSATCGRKGEDAVPWQIIHDPDAGEGLYTGIESSACVVQSVRRREGEDYVTVTLGVDETVSPFETVLQPGESYAFPPVFVGCFRGTIDDACNGLHRWLERCICPEITEVPFPLLMNNTWGCGYEIDQERVRHMIDQCAQLGMEALNIDAGWYRAMGCWRENPNRFPDGIPCLVAHAHERGVKLGLWTAWAQADDCSADTGCLSASDPVKRAWLTSNLPDGWRQPYPWVGTPVCLAHPDAEDWCLNEMRRLIATTGVDAIKHDQLTVSETCARTDHGHTSSPGDISLRGAAAYERIQDALLRDFPGVVFENCIGSGRTMDFSVIRRTHYSMTTDSYSPVAIRRAFHDLSFPFPPRILATYLCHQDAEDIHEFRYRLRSAMLGWCIIMLDTSVWSAAESECARNLFRTYKDRIRPLIRAADLYHVGPRPADDGWDAYQYFDPATEDGLLSVFRADSEQETLRVMLRGLEPERDYRLHFADGTQTELHRRGNRLMGEGLAVRLPQKRSSEWVFLSQAGSVGQ